MDNKAVQRIRQGGGFTIVELLIVVVVIAILAAITVVAYGGIQNSSHDASVQNDLRQLVTKTESHEVKYGRYPESTSDLASLALSVNGSSLGDITTTSPQHSSNVLYCVNTTTGKYSWLAASKSGTIYYRGSTGQGTLIYAGASSAELCALVNMGSGVTIFWGQNSGPWASWLAH